MDLIKKNKTISNQNDFEINGFQNKGVDDYTQPKAQRHIKDHPIDQVIGDIYEGVKTRNRILNEVTFSAFISEIEPSNMEEALFDNDWMIAMQEELN